MWLWLLTISVFFACLISLYSRDTNNLIEQNGQITIAGNYQRAEKGRLAKTLGESTARLVKTSCYTSQESKGANGRNYYSAASYLYPLGTWLDIEGVGLRKVETRTSKKYADRLDLWWGDDLAGCLEYGVQLKTVKVLDL